MRHDSYRWREVYQLTDEETVRGSAVKDFGADGLMGSLEVLNHPNYPKLDAEKKSEFLEETKRVYRACQNAYDRREGIFGRFDLDSEYFPIVIIRSLLPQLGHYLEMEDCKTAYMISRWICDDVRCWRQLMQDFGHKIGRDPRELQKPA